MCRRELENFCNNVTECLKTKKQDSTVKTFYILLDQKPDQSVLHINRILLLQTTRKITAYASNDWIMTLQKLKFNAAIKSTLVKTATLQKGRT